MGFFTTILSKLGIGDAAAATAPDAVSAASAASTAGTAASPVNVVDVVAQLEKSAAANPQKLNWRTSIVDLLKLQIGRAHVCTPVTNAHLVCRILLEKTKHN